MFGVVSLHELRIISFLIYMICALSNPVQGYILLIYIKENCSITIDCNFRYMKIILNPIYSIYATRQYDERS